VKSGLEVTVWRQGDGTDQHPGIVDSVSPEVQTLPGQVSPIRSQVVRGRRFMIRLLGEHDLLPGETVQIASGSPAWVRLMRRGVDWIGSKNGTGE